jgi:hypothetical protein
VGTDYAVVPLALMVVVSAMDYVLNGKTRFQTPKLPSSNEVVEVYEDR